ncbi:MAG: DUF4145 domain-containing protein [Candidatus Delongbacteria bacterium]|nr:DUF4145 domain-containing protein [Candidatus Delongbacteria bacterium]
MAGSIDIITRRKLDHHAHYLASIPGLDGDKFPDGDQLAVKIRALKKLHTYPWASLTTQRIIMDKLFRYINRNIDSPAPETMELSDLLQYLKPRLNFDDRIWNYAHGIRVMGNQGAHGNPVTATDCRIKLDELLQIMEQFKTWYERRKRGDDPAQSAPDLSPQTKRRKTWSQIFNWISVIVIPILITIIAYLIFININLKTNPKPESNTLYIARDPASLPDSLVRGLIKKLNKNIPKEWESKHKGNWGIIDGVIERSSISIPKDGNHYYLTYRFEKQQENLILKAYFEHLNSSSQPGRPDSLIIEANQTFFLGVIDFIPGFLSSCWKEGPGKKPYGFNNRPYSNAALLAVYAAFQNLKANNPRQKLELLHQSVELDPRFDLGYFLLARYFSDSPHDLDSSRHYNQKYEDHQEKHYLAPPDSIYDNWNELINYLAKD